MTAGDLVKVKARYADWGYGVGVYLGIAHSGGHPCLVRVLFEDRILVFHQHELELYNASR